MLAYSALMAAFPTISYAAASATKACVKRQEQTAIRSGSSQRETRENEKKKNDGRDFRAFDKRKGIVHLFSGGVAGVLVGVKLQTLAVVRLTDG